MEVDEQMNKSFLQFEPAPRRGEPEVRAYQSPCSQIVFRATEQLLGVYWREGGPRLALVHIAF